MSTFDKGPDFQENDFKENAEALAGAPPAAPLDRIEPLNLACRPFLNSRPVLRVSLLLWLLGLALLLGNVVLFQGYLTSSADKRQQIASGAQDIERQQQTAAQLQGRLDALDLESLNEQVDILNQKIEERTFSWSLLLDRLAEVLPNDVRIVRLNPRTGESARRETGRSRSAAATRNRPQDVRIPLTLSGETRSDEALSRFVDNLFAHAAFGDANPTREERQDEGNIVKFDLQVQYIPGGTPQGAAGGEVPTIEELPVPAKAPEERP